MFELECIVPLQLANALRSCCVERRIAPEGLCCCCSHQRSRYFHCHCCLCLQRHFHQSLHPTNKTLCCKPVGMECKAVTQPRLATGASSGVSVLFEERVPEGLGIRCSIMYPAGLLRLLNTEKERKRVAPAHGERITCATYALASTIHATVLRAVEHYNRVCFVYTVHPDCHHAASRGSVVYHRWMIRL